MSFVSLSFIIFVLVTLFLYYCVIPKSMQWILLLVASYGFYWMGGGKTILYLVVTTLSIYVAGLVLEKLNKQSKAEKDKIKRIRLQKKLVVFLVALGNFGMLFFAKYANEIIGFLQSFVHGQAKPIDLLQPLGISYFIFQSVGYVIDCYRGKYPVERHLGKLALFVSFFPQIVQGPIARHRDLAPQLITTHHLDWDNLKYGIQLILWGYFKKLVIAERAGVVVNTVLADYTNYSGGMIVASIFFYCIQLYCDFSGGIDITRGVAQMFGIHLAENFRRPIYATSLADYWRRWHITLGQWMKDYVFYPLSFSKPFSKFGKWTRRHVPGKLGKLIPAACATFVVYFFIGIWHGTSLKYFAFAFWNATIITASFLLEGWYPKMAKKLHLPTETLAWKIFQVFRTGVLVFFGRYLTRAPHFMAALWMMKQSVTNFSFSCFWDGTMLSLGLTAVDYVVMFVCMGTVLFVELLQEKGIEIRKALEQKSTLVQFFAVFFLVNTILLFGVFLRGDIPTGFIYQQF